MLPKPTNKYSINSVIKYYEHMILSDYFHLASVSENSILTILKATQVSKAAGIDNLSGRFLKYGVLSEKSLDKKFYPNLLVIYVISQLPLKSFLTNAK